MNINFMAVLALLGPEFAFRVANAVRPTADYLFSRILPEILRTDYSISSGNMTIRPTMAGLVGMDSQYPPGGTVEASSFLENTAKLALQVPLNETVLRQMQQLFQALGGGAAGNEALAQELLNFTSKVIVQPQLDVAEWLRGQALSKGAIDWTFNGINLEVDYEVPSVNKIAQRTGTAAYDQPDSVFWSDLAAARRKIRGGITWIIGSPETIESIIYNSANGGVIVADNGGVTVRTIGFRRLAVDDTGTPLNTQLFSNDARENIVLTSYGAEGEILDPANPANTLKIPFMEKGILIVIGSSQNRGFLVGQGATEDPNVVNRLGYTHVGPTVEGGGRPGRWARVYTPEGTPWSINGQTAQNLLPVIESPEQIVLLRTEVGGE